MRSRKYRLHVLPCLAAACLLFCFAAMAAPPQLYSQPAYQSPVRGEADDLLLMAGYGLAVDDTVVYRAIADTTQPLMPPQQLPAISTGSEGIAATVSTAGVPHSLTIVLPKVLEEEQSYALWVRNQAGEWSNGVMINDARPLWITPAYVFPTSPLASLPREIKIVGRNLRAAPGASTKVRLSGPQRVTLDSLPADASDVAIDRYAARVALPAKLAVGSYAVEVSRDGSSWVKLEGQQLSVRPEPKARPRFRVDDAAFGACRADDRDDDTACILKAIGAARSAGESTVAFGPGTWILGAVATPGVDSRDGIVVPAGVSLEGAGNTQTTLVRGASWNTAAGIATFTLLGRSTVQGFRFKDARTYDPKDPFNPLLRLGKTPDRISANDRGDAAVIDDVVITRNIFERTHIAIGDVGLPVRHLFVTYNEFGAYREALRLDGNRYNMAHPFRVDDSVVAYNSFKPGSYLDAAIGQGAIASEIGASQRLDFSHNSADGSSAQYLDSPTDARGWRAAWFWHLNNSNEQMLVAQNTATCTGDKAGDGEAIAYDNNANTFAFADARTVIAATAGTVTVEGPLQLKQNGREVRIPDYYTGHWLQIVAGRGIGQARRIASYRIDPATANVTFTVSPQWDVVAQPQASRITVGREFWQVYTVDNVIDNRRPLCLKSNRTRTKAGAITLWAQTADSVVAGNRQFDSDGISFQQSYGTGDPACATCDMGANLQSFVEIRGNAIDGEYDWTSDCSQSGIMGSNSAAPPPSAPPPTLSFGVSIAHNTIRHADGLRGGAITVPLTWYQGPPPHRWTVIDNLLIHHNEIRDLSGPPPFKRCDHAQRGRVGINLYEAGMVWRTVLYANTCDNVTTTLRDSGKDTIRVCPAGVSNSCECAR